MIRGYLMISAPEETAGPGVIKPGTIREIGGNSISPSSARRFVVVNVKLLLLANFFLTFFQSGFKLK
jgi:hypothetical protein